MQIIIATTLKIWNKTILTKFEYDGKLVIEIDFMGIVKHAKILMSFKIMYMMQKTLYFPKLSLLKDWVF